MKVRNYWLSWALAATVVFACAGVARAQVPTPAATPGFHNPPGWKPHVAYPFRHHHPYPASARETAGPPVEAPQGRVPAPTAPSTPSPEMLKSMRKAEEHARKYGGITEAPPLDMSKPQPFASPAPQGPVVPRGSNPKGGRAADHRA